MSDKTKRYSDRMLNHWQITEHPNRPWMATANRNLSFRKINRCVSDHPPTVVLLSGYRVFLFTTGDARDKFVEEYHRGFEAKAYVPHTKA